MSVHVLMVEHKLQFHNYIHIEQIIF